MLVPGISDHDGIPMVDLSTKPKLNKQKPRKVFLYKNAKVNYLKSDLREISELITSPVNASKSANEFWLQFKERTNYVRSTCLSSTKQFWSFIKKLKNNTTGLPANKSQGQLYSKKRPNRLHIPINADYGNHTGRSVKTVEGP